MKKLDWKLLTKEQIECRIATCKEGKTTILLYQNSRTAMDALDEMFGTMGWQITYKSVGDKVYGDLSVWDDERGQWIVKSDTGEESNISAEKGQSSDILKRCAVRFGYARELYTGPRIVISSDNKWAQYHVAHIAYNDNREISELQIADSDGYIVYDMANHGNNNGITRRDNPIGEDGRLVKALWLDIVKSPTKERLKTIYELYPELQKNQSFLSTLKKRKDELSN